MTERPRGNVATSADDLSIGASAMRWTGDGLVIDIEERDVRLGIPWRRRVCGQVKVYPEMLNATAFALDPMGTHIWHAIAPRAQIEVEMERPGIGWRGSGYLDSNRGKESLEDGFRDWHWSRTHLGREVAVMYEGRRRDGSTFASALRFDSDGMPHDAELPMVAPLPNTWWQMERKSRADRGHAGVIKTWEDSPFYARSTLATRLYGEPVTAVQESLSLDRFRSPIVQWMLPYKMPRRSL